MKNALKPFTSLISCYALLFTSLLSFYPSNSWACTSEDRDLIAPTCKAYQTFDYDLCACKDNDDHDEETRENLQEGFNSCVDDDNSQECYESLAASTAGMSGECSGDVAGNESSFKTSSEVDRSKNIVTTRNENGDLVPPNEMLCSKTNNETLGLDSKWKNFIKGIYIAISIGMYYGFKNTKNLAMSSCYGTVAFIGANLISLAAELISWFMNKDKLSTLVDEYEESTKCKIGGVDQEGNSGADETEDVADDSSSSAPIDHEGCNPLDPMEAQTKAFEFIIDERTIISELATSKQINYGIQSGLMGIAGILLFIQGVQSFGSDAACTAAGATGLNKGTEEKGLITGMLTSLQEKIISKAQAEEDGGEVLSCGEIGKFIGGDQLDESAVRTMPFVGQLICGAIIGGVITAISGGAGDSLYGALMEGTSGGVTGIILGVVSVFLAISYGILSHEYGIYSEKAKEQALEVAKVKDSILEQIEIICPSGRNDKSNPRCFCYNEIGERRTDRTKSETCQELFDALDAKLELTSGDLSLTKKVQRKCCVALDGSIDCDCNCQKFKNKQTGENACLKAVVPPSQMKSLAALEGSQEAINNMNSLTGSSSSGASVNTKDVKKNAKSFLGAARQLMKKISDKQIKKGKKPILVPSLDNMVRQTTALADKIPSAGLPFSPASSPASKVSKNKALASVKKKLKKRGFEFVGGGGSLRRDKKEKKKEDDFGFAFDAPEEQSGDKTETFMDKKYNYKKDDVYKNKNVSLWKILSNRYNTSGYLRLFEDEEDEQ